MKKPEIFKPNMNILNNNKKVYYSYLNDKLDIENETPENFINNLSQNNVHIFSKKVTIKTKDKEYITKIAGKIKDKIITFDNDILNIKDIIEISENKDE